MANKKTNPRHPLKSPHQEQRPSPNPFYFRPVHCSCYHRSAVRNPPAGRLLFNAIVHSLQAKHRNYCLQLSSSHTAVHRHLRLTLSKGAPSGNYNQTPLNLTP